MSTADTLAERAVEQAAAGLDTDSAVGTLLECCADKRVSVVMAKRALEGRLQETGEDPTLTRAVELLNEVLVRGPWGEAA